MNTDEQTRSGRPDPGNGQSCLFNDGKEGRPGEGWQPNEEAPERNRSKGGGGAVEGQGTGYVYFVETVDGAFVKIGYSKRVYGRLSELSTLRPGNFAIRMIGYFPGTVQTEAWLHVKFSADRDNGEWFRSTEILRGFIASMGLIEPVVRVATPVRQRRPHKLKRVVVLAEPVGIEPLVVVPSAITEPLAIQVVVAVQEIAPVPKVVRVATEPVTGKTVTVRVHVTENGRKGGIATAANRTPEERAAAAAAAATARWAKYYREHPEKLKAKRARKKKAAA